ncbi:MAG: AAA family ATPase [Candidatus Aenigmarchaeota archaeon]|nr:AAA family ATPase [Candidatus Aenigmarchaeota archaeon]
MPTKYIVEQPTLCMVVGVPASGKSLLARGLSQELLNGTYISKDLIQSPFTKERLTGNIYSMIRGPTFHILVSYADIQLGLHKIPIIDAPFSINHWRRDEYSDWISPFRGVAEKHNARLAVVRCVPPSARELKRRIERREYKWDGWKLENWDEFLKREPINFPIPHGDVYEVVTDRPVEKLVEDVLNGYLRASLHELHL